jgi:isopenicillin N synthase-like dioxygenase
MASAAAPASSAASAAGDADFAAVPLIDVSCIASLDLDAAAAAPDAAAAAAPPALAAAAAAAALGDAFRRAGFAYIRGYESVLPPELEERLDVLSRKFFQLPLEEKMAIPMSKSGRAWRGYFPVGGELTSGKPDIKEGVYMGQELPADDARVVAGWPVHGPNLFPPLAGFADAALAYMAAAERLGQKLMALVALSLGLPATYFVTGCTRSPLCLFRAFHYPPPCTLGPQFQDPELWGVGEHTDYGILTLLKQDPVGGLQLRNRAGDWVAAPFVPGTLVINIGDMLEVRRERENGRARGAAAGALVAKAITCASAPSQFSLCPRSPSALDLPRASAHPLPLSAGHDGRPVPLDAASCAQPVADCYASHVPILLRPGLRRGAWGVQPTLQRRSPGRRQRASSDA